MRIESSQQMFQHIENGGNLKLNKGKLLIKESTHTISEISSMLGFTSVHYFSRKFKQEFGITPSDYAKSIYQ